MYRNTSKSIPSIIDCDLKRDSQILIIFGANIFDTTCHKVAILVPTAPNVCFFTIWENLNMRNRTKMQYFIGFVSLCSAEADNGCGGKMDSYLSASCVRNIGVKNCENMIILLTIENVQDVFSGHGVNLVFLMTVVICDLTLLKILSFFCISK